MPTSDIVNADNLAGDVERLSISPNGALHGELEVPASAGKHKFPARYDPNLD